MNPPDADGIVETVVDGVQTFWVPCDGPLRAALSFRVGQVDETYLTSGITHLVEHLSLFGIADAAHHHNGFVDQTMTVLHTHGNAESVTDFLARVCGSLRHLPLHRLEAERGVLAAERARRAPSVAEILAVWRYGAQGHGLVGTANHGEQLVTADEVAAWARQHFTRQNAALWLSGPPPAGLRLDLTDGVRVPPPQPRPILSQLPGWFSQDVGGIAMAAILPRDRATPVVAQTIGEQLHERLRTELAISYAPWVSYEQLTAEVASVVLYADSTADRRGALAEHFARLLAEQVTWSPRQIEAARDAFVAKSRTAASDHPDELRLSMLVSRVRDALFGRPVAVHAALMADYERLPVEEYRACVQRLLDDALFALPGEAELTATFGRPVPASLPEPVTAWRRRRHRDHPVLPHTMVSTPEGVTRRFGQGQATVKYAELVGALRYPDGAITLVGPDAVHLAIEPTVWRAGARLAADVTARVDPALLRTLPSRAPGDIPRPQTTWWDRTKATALWPSVFRLWYWPMVVLSILFLWSQTSLGKLFVIGTVGYLLWAGIGRLRHEVRTRRAGRSGSPATEPQGPLPVA